MNKHEVAFCFAVFAAMMVSLSASAITQTLAEGDSLADAVTAAKADYDANLTPQEIVLDKGTYMLAGRQVIQFPLVIRGATGNPEDVTVEGSNKFQLFQLDHADAAILSVTLTKGRVAPQSNEYAPYSGAAVAIRIVDSLKGWNAPADGAGGMVSNCIVTACEAANSGYNSGVAGAAVACFSSKGLIANCVIRNNTSRRWASSTGTAGTIVKMSRGTMRNCLVTGNRQLPDGAEKRGDKEGCLVLVESARLIGCTIQNNACDGEKAAPISASADAKVVNCAIAGNTTTSELEHYATWAGTAEAFVNCVADGDSEINETCGNATLDDMKFLDVSGGDVRPLSGSALLGEGTVDAAYDYGTTDLYGKPRFRDATIDVGAAQFDAGAYALECSATPDARLYAPRTIALAVTKALGFGDAPVFYWDFDGDGKTDLVTTEPSVTQSFGAGVHSISVCVSNDVATFGAKYAFAEPFEVLAQPVRYVKAGNAGTEPYDTEANAAGDIQTAIDFCGEGEKIIVLKGIYNTTEAVDVNKQLEVVGATGDPEDVIIHNTVSGYRCLKVTKAGAFVASMALENGSPDWNHDHTSSYKGTGAYVTAGTVSNLVVRSCTSKYDSLGMGAAITAEGASTFITHCVITNNTASGGNRDGFYVSGVGLHLTGGAKAENCLVADNRTSFQQSWYGNGHCAVFVGDKSRLRFCTVVGNSCRLFGGIGVYGTGVFEECLVAGNTSTGLDTLNNRARHILWSAFPEGVKLTEAAISSDESQATEAEYAATIAPNQVYNATDVEAHGLGATTVLATTDRLIRNLAKKDWLLPKGSPAIDKVPVEAAADMAMLDVYGNKRLFGGVYDIGCHERLVPGLILLVK